MRKRILPSGKLNFPDPKRIYDRNGKDDIVLYIKEFDRCNALRPGGTFVKGERI